ncbi:hypothetical protein Tco_0867761 [Tanacetum coccineum]
MKDLVANKPLTMENEDVRINRRCSPFLLNQLHPKEKDPGSFILPCSIGRLDFNNALAELGASISIMPFSIYKRLGTGKLKTIKMKIELADNSKCIPKGIVRNLLIKIDKFILPIECDEGSLRNNEIRCYWKSKNDNDRTNIEWNDLSLNDWLKIKYGEVHETMKKKILTEHWRKRFGVDYDDNNDFMTPTNAGMVEDSVWSKRYSEWCNENSHDKKPRPRDYTFKEWVKLKKGHLDISKLVRKDLFRSWVIDQFTEALDPDKDPLERCLD